MMVADVQLMFNTVDIDVLMFVVDIDSTTSLDLESGDGEEGNLAEWTDEGGGGDT